MKKWSFAKEMLFTYLAINKILYWYGYVASLSQNNLSNVGQAILQRILSQDLIIIISLVFFYYFDKFLATKKSKLSDFRENVISYTVGYVVLMSFMILYTILIHLIMQEPIDYWGILILYGTGGYITVAVVLYLKNYFKKKTATPDEKLVMLTTLRDSGILTEEEFEAKVALL